MAVDRRIDSAQLDSDLSSIANAIRAKSGGSSQLAFPAGFVSEIGNIPSGDTTWNSPNGLWLYKKDMEIPVSNYALSFTSQYADCSHMESIRIYNNNMGQIPTVQPQNTLKNCSALKTAKDEIHVKYGHYFFQNDRALQTVQLGSIGFPVTTMTTLVFSGCTQSGLTITIYVADDATLPLSNSPFGATNATIIYRSATSGEVKTV